MKKKQLNRERSGGVRLLSALLAIVLLCGLLVPGGAMVVDTYADGVEAVPMPVEGSAEVEPADEAPAEETPTEEPTTEEETPVEEEVPVEEETPAEEETPVEEETPEEEEAPVEEEAPAISAADELFNRLMACETYEELDAAMEAMTEEEYAIMNNEFSDEQNAALSARVAELQENETATLVNIANMTIQQGGNKITENVQDLNKDSKNFSSTVKKSDGSTESGIHVNQNTGNNEAKRKIKVEVDPAVEPGDYTVTATWKKDNKDYTATFTVTVTKAKTIGVVQGTTLNATVNMFNYGSGINSVNEELRKAGFTFYNYGKNSVDGTISQEAGIDAPKMKPTLSAGYPMAEKGSMAYLFSNTWHVGETMTNGGGLFQKDANGYYYYDAALNAAYFNGTNFTLYDTVIRPGDINKDAKYPLDVCNFLPFNELNANTTEIDPESQANNGTQTAKLTKNVDLWFGMTVDFDFLMPKAGKVNNQNMVFEFEGDDDVFVYIDGVLILDIGGTHRPASGTINFATGDVVIKDENGNVKNTTIKKLFEAAGKDTSGFNGNTFADWTTHKLNFFYLERGGYISYCRLKFNLPTLPDKSLTVGKQLETYGDAASSDVTNYLNNTLEYKFRVWKADANGNKTTELLSANTTYTLIENNAVVGTREVGADGIFTLKPNQQAQFTNLPSGTKYIVEELIPTELIGQYGEIQYTNSGASSKVEGSGSDATFTSYYTDAILIDNNNNVQVVTFTNKVDVEKLSLLRVTKKLAPGSETPAAGTKFQIQVKLGDQLLPVGTQYLVGKETRTVQTAGIILLGIDETAEILTKVISGTEYEITEVNAPDWTAFYSCEVTTADGTTSTVPVAGNTITGEFPLNSTVHATVTNSSYDFGCEIPISKTLVGYTGTEGKTFTFDVAYAGTTNSDKITVNDGSITVTDDQATPGTAMIGFDSTIPNGDYTFTIQEIVGTDGISYDTSVYKAVITVNGTTATLKSIVKVVNGVEQPATNNVAAFVNYATTDVVISKTVKGNMGDWNKEFTFTVTYGEKTETHKLKHKGSVTIKDVPIGATIEVVETVENGYTTTIVCAEVANTYSGDSKTTYIGVVPANGMTIQYTNTNEALIDTGIALDALPYVVILAVAAAGIAVVMIRKRRVMDED